MISVMSLGCCLMDICIMNPWQLMKKGQLWEYSLSLLSWDKTHCLWSRLRRDSLELIIESVGSAEDSARGEGPSISVVSSLFEVLEGDILIADVIVNEGDGVYGSCILVIMELIVFGIGHVDFGAGMVA